MFKKSVYFTLIWGLFCLVGTAGVQGEQGDILFEYWDGIGDTLDNLHNSDKWPDQPDRWEYRTSLEGESDWADTYSTRVRGFLHPPQTGTYFFWIASDDGSELWLSKSEDPDSATPIAHVSEWTDPREWTKFPSQKSGAIHLEASNRYL
jgi:xyloglucan-specific exo-beta-1,4-glucanase